MGAFLVLEIIGLQYVLLCVLLNGDFCHGRENDGNNRPSSKEINERLDILTNEVTKLKEESPANDPFRARPADFVPLQAKREVTDEGVIYTVGYRSSGMGWVNAMWYSDQYDDDGFSRELLSNEIPMNRQGYHETRYRTRDANGSYIVLFLSSQTSWYTIMLINNGQGNKTVDIIIPEMLVDPQDDLVYKTGENATLKVTRSIDKRDDRERGPGSHYRVNLRLKLLDLETMELVPRADIEEGYWQEVEEKKYFDYVEETFEISTAEHDVSGVVTVNMEVGQSNELVMDVVLARFIKLYPESQSGPFPVGFMAFETHSGAPDTGGPEVVSCSTDRSSCEIFCTVWGSNLSRLEMRKVLPDGTTTPLDYSSFFLRESSLDYVKSLGAYVDITPGEQQRLQCVAWNRDGRSIIKNTTIRTFLRAHVVADESSIVRYGDMANLTCTVAGDPLPSNITFDISYAYQSYQYVAPDEIYLLAPDKMVARKTIKFDDGDEYGYSAQSTGILYNAVCNLLQENPSRPGQDGVPVDSYYYDISDALSA